MKSQAYTRLLLIRHAEVEERYQHVFGGRVDMDLSPRGHEQAAALAGHLKGRKIDQVFASPMQRVQQTLAPYQNQGAPQPVLLPELREVDFGDWTGHGWHSVQTTFGVSAFTWLEQLDCGGIPNAENITAYRSRIATALATIREAPAGTTVAVFCHGGVIRMLLALLVGLPFPQTRSFAVDYASVTEVLLKEEHNEIVTLNFTPWRPFHA
jgi:broad specificity phosphatase PhoE